MSLVTAPPNFIQFTTLYQCLNQACWKARLNCSTQTNLSNLRTHVNHSIVKHDFQFPFNHIGTESSQLIGVTHQFKAWDNQKVQYTVIINVHPCFITQYPIIRTGHRGDCPLVIVAWWDLPHHLPSELEDTLLYNSQNTLFQLILLIMLISLGTNPSFPGQNIEGTLPGNAQFTEDVLTWNIARKF